MRVDATTLRITDTRDGRQRVTELSGDAAVVYDACHAGLTERAISDATALPVGVVRSHLAKMIREHVVLQIRGILPGTGAAAA